MQAARWGVGKGNPRGILRGFLRGSRPPNRRFAPGRAGVGSNLPDHRLFPSVARLPFIAAGLPGTDKSFNFPEPHCCNVLNGWGEAAKWDASPRPKTGPGFVKSSRRPGCAFASPIPNPAARPLQRIQNLRPVRPQEMQPHHNGQEWQQHDGPVSIRVKHRLRASEKQLHQREVPPNRVKRDQLL